MDETGLLEQIFAPPQYRDPVDLVGRTLGRLLPKKRVSVRDHAAQNRFINNPGSYVGPLRWETAPYLEEPHLALDDRTKDCLALVGPGQSGKTTVAEDFFLYLVDQEPAKTLWYMQTRDGIEAYVKDRIDQMIEDHPTLLKARMGDRPSDNGMHMKKFRGMNAEFLWATKSNLINKRAPFIILDELDAYPPDLGDVKRLADIRRQTFDQRSFVLCISHPDRATGLNPERDWNQGVMAVYRDSTRCTWWWPCLDCEVFSSPNPGTTRFMELKFNRDLPLDDIAESAGLVCPSCGCASTQDRLWEMNNNGLWCALGQEVLPDGSRVGNPISSRTAGYWITGTMAAFTYGGWGQLAHDIVEAEREFEIKGDDNSLREVHAKRLGLPYRRRSIGEQEPLDEETLAKRAEPWAFRQVPPQARFLVAGCDVQGGRFVIQVEAVGPRLERWLIDRFDIRLSPTRRDSRGQPVEIKPGAYAEDWDVLEEQLLGLAYPLAADPGRQMRVAWACCDSGGHDGVTHHAYTFWRKMKTKLKHRRFRLVKGVKTGPTVRETFPDSPRKDRKAEARGEIPVLLCNTELLGDMISGDLKREQRGVSCLHLSDQVEPFIFEELTAEIKTLKGWEQQPGMRNEAWDICRYTRGLLAAVGVDRIKDWNKPLRAWAAAQDAGNPWVERIESAGLENSDPAGALESGGAVPAAGDGAAHPVPVSPPPPAARPRNSLLERIENMT